jgi:hypothetical protein
LIAAIPFTVTMDMPVTGGAAIPRGLRRISATVVFEMFGISTNAVGCWRSPMTAQAEPGRGLAGRQANPFMTRL